MRSFYMAGRIVTQLIKDRRTLALMFLAPLFVLFILYTVLNSSIDKPRIETVGLPSGLAKALEKQADIQQVKALGNAVEDLKNQKTDAVVTYRGSELTVRVEGTQTTVTAAVKKAVAAALGEYSKEKIKNDLKSQSENLMNELKQQMTGQIGRILQQSGAAGAVRSGSSSLRTPELTMPSVTFKLEVPQSRFIYLNGSDTMTAFDSIAAMMMGFFIFFFVFLIAGVSFLHERISGTMERLLATPIRRYEIVMGYFIGFGIFVVAQTLLIQLFMVYALHIPLKGNFLLVLLVNVLLASGSLSLGTFLSAFARNEFQMIQFIPIVIVPQILFCGLFDLRAAPLWVTVLSKLFPLTYGADALNSIALRGMGVSSIANDLAVMGVFTVLFLILNTLALKRYRKI